jgi:hypothetical protein
VLEQNAQSVLFLISYITHTFISNMDFDSLYFDTSRPAILNTKENVFADN